MDYRNRLLLCVGLPGSGTTLVSWCFLQRSDTDGVLDAPHDLLPDMPEVRTPNRWCKCTIGSFRATEFIEHFSDLGFDVQPVLVVRDVRSVFNSLLKPSRGGNGTTAEEPPLRLRLRRFLADWRALREQSTIIRYESLLRQPEAVLQAACGQVGLSWSGDMLAWPKPIEAIAEARDGSPAFHATRGGSLIATVDPTLADLRVERVPQDDLDWLSAEFAEYNTWHDYPSRVPRATCKLNPVGRAEPSFANTRRYRQQHTLQRLVGRRLSGLRQAVRRSVWMPTVTPLSKPPKSQANYFGYSTLFAD